MCGRYYVDDETSREIEKIVRNLDQKLKMERTKDVYPSQQATVLMKDNLQLTADQMQWGFPGYGGKGLLINVRAEGVLEKKTFRDSVLHRRCIIPAKGFYEWNKRKEKFTFRRTDDASVLYMAGCYRAYEGQNRFVILTTQANNSVATVHERMPLILERQEMEDWVMEDGAVEFILRKTPPMLRRSSEYEQMELFQ